MSVRLCGMAWVQWLDDNTISLVGFYISSGENFIFPPMQVILCSLADPGGGTAAQPRPRAPGGGGYKILLFYAKHG